MHYKELIRGCRAFVEKEPRDAVYRIALEKVSWQNIDDTVDAITVFLFSWNAPYYRYHPYTSTEFYSIVAEILERTRPSFYALQENSIEGVDFEYELPVDNETIKAGELIKNIFSEFSDEKAIGKIGAAKAIHLLAPELFVMWDNAIIRQYHRTHGRSYWRTHKAGDRDCFLEFMEEMQSAGRESIETCCHELDCPAEEARERIRKECSGRVHMVSLAKALDQNNYARYSKGWIE